MNSAQKILTYLIFLSLPVVATFKGKGTIILLGLFLVITLSKSFNFPSIFTSIKNFFNNPKKSPFSVLVCLFLVWGFISLEWNSGTVKDIGYYGRAIGTLVLGGLCLWGMHHLPLKDKKVVDKASLIGFLLYWAFYISEIYGGSFVSRYLLGQQGFDFDRYLKGTVILIFLVWPAFLAFKYFIRSPFWKGSFIALVVIGMFFILKKARPDAALLAFCFSLVIFALSYRFKFISQMLGATSIALLWAFPIMFLKFITPDQFLHSMHLLKQSYQHRLQMWHEFSKLIWQHPFMGYGFNATEKIQNKMHLCIAYSKGTFFPLYRENLHMTTYEWGVWVCHKEALLGTHPHNGFIQVWFEFGMVGAFLLSCLIWMLTKKLAHLEDNFIRAIAMGVFASYLVIWSVSFGIWQTWMISLLFLTIGLVIAIKALLMKDKKNANPRL